MNTSNNNLKKGLVRLFERQTASTHLLLSEYTANSSPPHFFTISTADQTAGLGQHGSRWAGAAHSQIALSLLIRHSFPAKDQFLLNIWTSLAVHQFLRQHLPESNLAIKWPNDLLVEEKKIAGILIKSTVSGTEIKEAQIGIGLNVTKLPTTAPFQHTSLADHGCFSRPEFIREALLGHLYRQFYQMNFRNPLIHYRPDYHQRLWGLGETVSFKENGEIKTGRIDGINEWGGLQLFVNDQRRVLRAKEVAFLLGSKS